MDNNIQYTRYYLSSVSIMFANNKEFIVRLALVEQKLVFPNVAQEEMTLLIGSREAALHTNEIS